MKKSKKLTALALAAAMIVTAMTGCSSKSSDSAQSSSDAAKASESSFNYTGAAPVTDKTDATVSILAQNSYYSTVDYSKAEIINTLADKAGVKINWTLVSPTNYKDSVSPMLASGSDLPDIVQLPDLDPNMTYISSGLFKPLDEYMDEMPNFKKFLEANPTIKASLTAEDGHIYYVPQTVVTNNFQPCTMINMEWLSKLGLSVPTTLDDFVKVLEAFRDGDPNGNGQKDEIPMSVMAAYLPYMFGPAFGLDLVSGFYADDNGTVHYAAAESDNYKKYLTFLNKLYTEGLLEVEYTSLTRDQITERCANNLTGVTFDYSWQMSQTYSSQYADYNGTSGVMVGIAPLSGDYKGYYVARNPISNVFGVSSNSKDTDLAIRFLDYAMSDEAQDYYVWGIEGESYTKNADGTKAYTEKAKDNSWLQQLGINAGCLPSQQSVEATDVLLPQWHVDVDKSLEQYMHAPFPFIYATTDEANIISQYQVDIQTYVDEMNVAFISGTTSLDQFDSYISTLNSMGLKDLLKVKQEQYSKYKAAQK